MDVTVTITKGGGKRLNKEAASKTMKDVKSFSECVDELVKWSNRLFASEQTGKR